jgi:hypothetical protein
MTRFVIDAPTLLHLGADGRARSRAEGIVPVGAVEQLSSQRGAGQSAGSSTQSGPLTSPGPARSAASTIVYA